MHQTFTAWVMRDEEWLDEPLYRAYCEEVPSAGGFGRTRAEALDDLAINIDLWLDYYRDHLRADLPPGAKQATVSVKRNESDRACQAVTVERPDAAAGQRTPRGTFTAIIEPADDWLIARCPEVPSANGQGRTREEVIENLADSIDLLFLDRRAVDLDDVGPDAEVLMVTLK